MPNNSKEEQWEGREHHFLDYQEVIVHFIYSFAWDITARTWPELETELVSQDQSNEGGNAGKGWTRRQLHSRAMFADKKVYSYQPSLVGKTFVLEKSGTLASQATVLSPKELYQGAALPQCHELNLGLDYCLRLFDNGSGICTFAARFIPKHPKDFEAFQDIHRVLHLANNLAARDDCQGEPLFLTNSFIKLPKNLPDANDSLFPSRGRGITSSDGHYCSLHDLFRRWLVDPPEKWAPTNATALWVDSEVLDIDTTDSRKDFQTPLVFTVAKVERQSFLRFRKSPTIAHAKEVGSLLCKLTLDSRDIRRHYLDLSEDYITGILPFNKDRGGLLNLCLDRRLFFALSRRGAIAITSDFENLPSCFVLPSLLNLCEILRARWHLGSLVNIKLDKVIGNASGVDPASSPSAVMDELFKWRALSASFFRDPVPFLFDGGSITEIAENAEDRLWLAKMREEITRKFSILDRLLQDLYVRKQVEELSK